MVSPVSKVGTRKIVDYPFDVDAGFGLLDTRSPSPSSSPSSSFAGLGFLGGLPRGRLGFCSSPSGFGLCVRTRVNFSMQAVCVRVYVEKHTFGGLPRFFLCGSPAAVLDGPAAAGGGADDASLLFLFLLPFGRPRRRFSGAVGSAALARGGKIARARVRISISGRS